MKVKDLFSINKELSKFQVIAGEKGLDRVISDIDVLEIPDGLLWIDSEEFSLTTGYYYRNNPAEFIKVVEAHYNRNAAGIGIKLGRFIESLPKEVLDRADELEIPILDIPINLGYRDIVWPVVSSLLGESTYDEYVLSEFKGELNTIIEKKYYLNEIILLLRDYMDSNEVYILDKELNSIIKSISLDSENSVIKKMIEESTND